MYVTHLKYIKRNNREFLKELVYSAYDSDSRFYHKYTMRAFPDYPINAEMSFKITF